jgi:hypothetical protein
MFITDGGGSYSLYRNTDLKVNERLFRKKKDKEQRKNKKNKKNVILEVEIVSYMKKKRSVRQNKIGRKHTNLLLSLFNRTSQFFL